MEKLNIKNRIEDLRMDLVGLDWVIKETGDPETFQIKTHQIMLRFSESALERIEGIIKDLTDREREAS